MTEIELPDPEMMRIHYDEGLPPEAGDGSVSREVALRGLRNTADIYAKAAIREHAASFDRAKAIREGIAAGIPVAEIARITGLSRARIYQIRDGKR